MSLVQPLKAGSRAAHSGPWICIISLKLQNQQPYPLSFSPARNLYRYIITHPFQWKVLLSVGECRTQLRVHRWQRHCRSQNTSPLHSLCRRPAGIFFYLSFLAGAFQNGNASYLLTSRSSVYLWISFPPLVCQYPSLLIFWAGCMAHLFAQALDWGRGGEHVWFILEGTLSWADTDQQAICFICKFLMVARGCLDTFNK